MYYLVCFDISDNKTRNRAGRYLCTFGNRVQRSVFEIELEDNRTLQDLKNKLAGWLDTDDDLRFYRLCQSCRQLSYTVRDEKIATRPSFVII